MEEDFSFTPQEGRGFSREGGSQRATIPGKLYLERMELRKGKILTRAGLVPGGGNYVG